MFVDVSPYYTDRFLNLKYLKSRGFSPFIVFLSTVALLTSIDYVTSVYKVYSLDQELLGMGNEISELEQSDRSDKAVKVKEQLYKKAKDFSIDGAIEGSVKNSSK